MLAILRSTHREQGWPTFMFNTVCVVSAIVAFPLGIWIAIRDKLYHVTATRGTPPYIDPDLSGLNIGIVTDTILLPISVLILLLPTLLPYMGYKHTLGNYRTLGQCHSLGLVAAFAMQLEIVEMIKHRTGALRPNGEYGSFVSEHTASAECLCGYLLLVVLSYVSMIGPKLVLVVILIAYPWWVAVTRIIGNHHYAADVVGGYAVGLNVAASLFVVAMSAAPAVPHKVADAALLPGT